MQVFFYIPSILKNGISTIKYLDDHNNCIHYDFVFMRDSIDVLERKFSRIRMAFGNEIKKVRCKVCSRSFDHCNDFIKDFESVMKKYAEKEGYKIFYDLDGALLYVKHLHKLNLEKEA